MPRRSEFVSAAKMAACALSAKLGFTCDRMRDVGLAVEEACSFLAGLQPSDRCQQLTVRYGVGPDKVTVEVCRRGTSVADRGPALAFYDADGEPVFALLRTLMDDVRVLCDAEHGAYVAMVAHRPDA